MVSDYIRAPADSGTYSCEIYLPVHSVNWGRRVTLERFRPSFEEDRVMPEATLSGAEFKQQLRDGKPKMGLFLNAHSPTVAEQLAYSGYDWLLVDTQHGPMNYEKLSAMLSGISNGGAKSLV